jgi:Plasma-membrane choline transporter
VEYFNKWAFIYVGIYGMPYIKAGKSVIELFQSRGWEAVIADDLVGSALFLVSLIVGLIMGGIAIGIERGIDSVDLGNESLIVYFIGFVVGLLVTSILMSTIASAVNAVIVLFAEGPNDFERNYPELSRKMRETWSQVYPGSV